MNKIDLYCCCVVDCVVFFLVCQFLKQIWSDLWTSYCLTKLWAGVLLLNIFKAGNLLTASHPKQNIFREIA